MYHPKNPCDSTSINHAKRILLSRTTLKETRFERDDDFCFAFLEK